MSEIGAAKGLLDDTPVNGEVGKGITSNWAYDEDVTLRALIEATLPWMVSIDPFLPAKSNINRDTIDVNYTRVNCAVKASSGAQDDEIAWDIVLGAGTWTLQLMGTTYTDTGIYTVKFDGVTKGTIDGYSGTAAQNALSNLTGIVVPLTKKIELKLVLATKNDTSSSYVGRINAIRLLRTA